MASAMASAPQGQPPARYPQSQALEDRLQRLTSPAQWLFDHHGLSADRVASHRAIIHQGCVFQVLVVACRLHRICQRAAPHPIVGVVHANTNLSKPPARIFLRGSRLHWPAHDCSAADREARAPGLRPRPHPETLPTTSSARPQLSKQLRATIGHNGGNTHLRGIFQQAFGVPLR